jgi:hypothetical protein
MNHTMRLSRLCLDCTTKARQIPKQTPNYFDLLNDHAMYEAALLPHRERGLVHRFLIDNPEAHAKVNADFRRIRQKCKQYSIPVKTWVYMFAKSGGTCSICHRPVEIPKLCVDHDHHSGEVRGLLCTPCNTGLGMLGIDGPSTDHRIKSVIAYLEEAANLARSRPRRKAG